MLLTLPHGLQDPPSKGSHVGSDGSSQQAPVRAHGRPVLESAQNDSIRPHSCNQSHELVAEDYRLGYQPVAPTGIQLERIMSQPTVETAPAELGLLYQS